MFKIIKSFMLWLCKNSINFLKNMLKGNAEFGTDHYIHLRIIKHLRINKKYLVNDIFTKDEKYSFYPFLMHWIIAKTAFLFPKDKNYLIYIPLIKILRIITFNIFIVISNVIDNVDLIMLTNIIYLTFPFSYLKWNAINKGISARGFGLLITEMYLYVIYFYMDNQSVYLYLGICLMGLLLILSSQFATQFFLISSLFLSLKFIQFKWIFIPLISFLLFYLLFPKVAKSYFFGQLNHKTNYFKFLLKTHFKYRKSIYRDFVYDFIMNFRKDYKFGLKYFMTNPYIEITYGFIYLMPILFLTSTNLDYNDSITIIIFSSLFAFIVTSFKITRFLGEPQRYIQFVLPFISIFLVKIFQINIIYTFITCAFSFILFYLFYFSKESKVREVSAILKESKIFDFIPEGVVILSNDTQVLKVMSLTNDVVSIDFSHPFKNQKEFDFYFPNNYMTISPNGLKLFHERYKSEYLLLNKNLYSESDFNDLKSKMSISKLYRFDNYFLYKII